MLNSIAYCKVINLSLLNFASFFGIFARERATNIATIKGGRATTISGAIKKGSILDKYII